MTFSKELVFATDNNAAAMKLNDKGIEGTNIVLGTDIQLSAVDGGFAVYYIGDIGGQD